MFETLVIIAIVLAIIIAVVLILASTKPDTFRIQRAAVMNAPAEKIFPLIADFHQWLDWSPWEGRDPALKRIYSGTERGKGAVYAWDGNKNVGSGRMEILEASSPSKVVIKLDFLKPFEAHNTAEVHNAAAGRCDQRHLGDAWSRSLHVEGDAGVHEHGPHDRQGLRSRPHQPQGGFREVSDHPLSRQPRSERCLIPTCSTTAIAKPLSNIYEKVLGGKIEFLMRADEGPADMKPSPGNEKKIMHARMSIGAQLLMASDAPPDHFHKPQGFCGVVDRHRPRRGREEVQGPCRRRSENMPFEKTFFSKGFGMCVDQFGQPWMVNCPLEGMG